jgi:hypothetical protein
MGPNLGFQWPDGPATSNAAGRAFRLTHLDGFVAGLRGRAEPPRTAPNNDEQIRTTNDHQYQLSTTIEHQ